LNDVYAELLGAHLLATLREAFAVAPALKYARVIGARPSDTGAEILFDVEATRAGHDWSEDTLGTRLLATAELGLHRVGRTSEIRGWPSESLRPDVVIKSA